jgi:hypothetical protein
MSGAQGLDFLGFVTAAQGTCYVGQMFNNTCRSTFLYELVCSVLRARHVSHLMVAARYSAQCAVKKPLPSRFAPSIVAHAQTVYQVSDIHLCDLKVAWSCKSCELA